MLLWTVSYEFIVQCESNRRLLYKVWSKSKGMFKAIVYSSPSCWFMMMNTKFSTFNQNVYVSIIMHGFKTLRRSQVSKSRKRENVWIQKPGLKLKAPGLETVSFPLLKHEKRFLFGEQRQQEDAQTARAHIGALTQRQRQTGSAVHSKTKSTQTCWTHHRCLHSWIRLSQTFKGSSADATS